MQFLPSGKSKPIDISCSPSCRSICEKGDERTSTFRKSTKRLCRLDSCVNSLWWPSTGIHFRRKISFPPLFSTERDLVVLFQFPVPSGFLKDIHTRLIPRHPVTSILPSIFPLIMYFRRQFLRKMWSIKVTSLLFIVCRIYLSSLNFCNTSFFTRSAQLTFSSLLQHHISNLSRYFWPTFRCVKVSASYVQSYAQRVILH